MSKKKNRVARKQKGELTSITVYVTAFMFGVVGYLGGQFALDEIHPLHWLTGILGIVLGYFVGRKIYRSKGDILGF